MTIDIDAIRNRAARVRARTCEPATDHEAYELARDAQSLLAKVDELTAELDRVRADLAAAHNHAHRQDTNLQQIARAKDEIAAERDALKQQLAEILAMAERFDTPRDSSRVRVFLGDLKHLAYKAITEHKVAVAR